VAVLYTTHYMEEAETLCHRVGIIDEGQIIALDAPKNLIHRLGKGLIRIGIAPTGEKSLARLRALPQVKAVSYVEGQLAVEVTDAQQALLGIITACQEDGIAMTSLEILESNLESVFLHLTGKRLRD
jgi:ABC-2 type transport system ATP-binding protein